MTSEQSNPWPSTGTPLDDVNADFHNVYQAGQQGAALADPVFVLIDHELIVVWNQREQRLNVTPRAFHVLKSVAHAPVGIYALLLPACDKPVGPALSAQTQGLLKRIQNCEGALNDLSARQARKVAASVIETSIVFLSGVVSQAAVTKAELDVFAHAMGALLLELTDAATRLALDCLHEAVQDALAQLPESSLAKLQVVVVGDHQTRDRSLAMQYFRKRLRDPEGVEDRVAFAEGVQTVEQALALVGTRRLDRQLAGAFFGEAKRLQRDVLGDAAKTVLDSITLDPIGEASGKQAPLPKQATADLPA